MKAFLILIPTLALAGRSWAQSTADRIDYADIAVIDPGLSAGHFLIAISTGVVLAYCFQWLLTNLSGAVGLSAMQGLTDTGKREKARAKAREKESEKSPEERTKDRMEKEEEGWEDKVVKVESGIGIWAMATASIALFFACWLGIELIGLQDNMQAAILGLVVWGIFMGTMMRLEGSMASSMVGFIADKAKAGAGMLASPIKSAVGHISESRAQSAQRDQAVKTAEEIAAAVRKELFPEPVTVAGPGITDKVREFVASKVKPKAVDLARMGEGVKSLLKDPELVEMAKRGELQAMDKEHFAEIVAGRTDLQPEQITRLSDTLHGSWSKFLGEHAPEASSETAPAMAEGGSGNILERYRKFKEFLRSTGREELQPERLEKEMKTLVLDPKAGLSQLKEHARELDRESLVQALGHRKDMTPEEANRIADQIDLARAKALSAKEKAEHRASELRDKVMASIRDHVYAAGRPELDYEGIEGDFNTLFDDPKAGYSALKERLKNLDKESVIALLSTFHGVDRLDAEKLVEKGEALQSKAGAIAGGAKEGLHSVADRIVAAKDSVLEKARKVEEETQRRLHEAKRISIEQAEATRKVASTAAWWLLAIAVVSGVAAALGGIAAAGT